MNNFVQDLGLGELPILSDENKGLNEDLKARQVEIAKLKGLNSDEGTAVDQIFSHWNNLKDSIGISKNVKVAKRQNLATEHNLLRFSQVCMERNYRDLTDLQTTIDKVIDANETLEEDITAKATINELLEDEHMTDVEALLEWAAELDSHEEDMMALLKYQNADLNHIKLIHLRLEKLRQKAAKDKKLLDEASTENKMSLLALDKTAVEFRTLHEDRQKALDKWKEAVDLIERRDMELEELFKTLNDTKGKTTVAETELKQQMTFLANETGNNTELQRLILEEERKAQALNEELEAKETELDELDGQVILERRETWRIGGEIDTTRARWQNAKRQYKHKLSKIGSLNEEIKDLKNLKREGGNKSLSAEEKANEIGRLLDAEQQTHDTLQWELERTQEKKVKNEQNLHELKVKHGHNAKRLKGMKLEKRNLSKKVKLKTDILLKKEEIVLTASYTLSQLERELTRLKGQEVNRVELKALLDQLKVELESRLSDKRNLDHLVHKMMADVGKVTRDLIKCDQQLEKVKGQLEKVDIENESCNKDQKQIQEKIEALLLEEKMIKLNEKKVRQGLESLNKDLMDLQVQDLEVNEKLREERADLESRRELYASQVRCLKEEISTIKGEIRERKDKAEKLKIKYDLIVKALGANQQKEGDSNPMPSHAFQLVKLAQEKAELRDQSETVSKRLEKEEKELLGLENAMTLLKKSNHDFRTANLQKKRDEADNDEVYFLQEKIKLKTKLLRKLKKEFQEATSEADHYKSSILKNQGELELLQRTLEEKSIELRQLDRDMEEQERKLERAQAVRNTLAKELRAVAQNADFFEQDMDLRAEKEKQQSALIKLKEIASIDDDFSSQCQSQLQKIGFSLPTLSRLSVASQRPKVASKQSSAGRYSTGSGSFFRSSQKSVGSSNAGGVVEDSVLVMEMASVPMESHKQQSTTA